LRIKRQLNKHSASTFCPLIAIDGQQQLLVLCV
jgi:hypothetical protein